MTSTKRLVYIKPTKSGESFTFVDPINNNLYYIKTNVFHQRPKLNGCYEMSLDPKWIHEYESEGRNRRHFRIFINASSEEAFNQGIEYVDKSVYEETGRIKKNKKFYRSRRRRRMIFSLIFFVMFFITVGISFATTKWAFLGFIPIVGVLAYSEFKLDKEWRDADESEQEENEEQ